MNTSNKLTGGKGTKRLLATTVYTGMKREAIVAESSCTVTTCTGVDKRGDAINFKTHTDFEWTAFEPGVTYTVPNGWYITAVTLATGNGAAY